MYKMNDHISNLKLSNIAFSSYFKTLQNDVFKGMIFFITVVPGGWALSLSTWNNLYRFAYCLIRIKIHHA